MDDRMDVFVVGSIISVNFKNISAWARSNGYQSIGANELREYAGNNFTNLYNTKKNELIQNVTKIKKEFGW